MAERMQITEGKPIAVWPCDHGNILVEPGPAKPGYQCSECGSVAATYLPAQVTAEAIYEQERMRAELMHAASQLLRIERMLTPGLKAGVAEAKALARVVADRAYEAVKLAADEKEGER